MAFLKAFGGALGGSFANQWLEYMAPPSTMTDHTLIARAVAVKSNGSENNDGEENAGIISNGSKFMVPEGTCLVTVENGGSRDGNEADVVQPFTLQGELVADGVGIGYKGVILCSCLLNAYTRTEIDGV